MEFLQKIREKWQTVLTITVLVAAIVFSISAFLTPQYGSKVSILVIQVQPNDKVDAFSAAKSAEYLSDILARVIYSESFVQNILESPFDAKIDFPLDAEKKKEYWKNKIDVKRVNNTGIIEVAVFDRDRLNAEKIAEAISWAYNIKGNEYHGGGDRVKIEKIDGPITSINPTKPNLLLNTLLGIILGLVGSVAVIFFLEDFELRIFGKRKKSEQELNNQKQEELNFPSSGILNFRKKHHDYASFDEYVFDARKKMMEEDAALEKIAKDEKRIAEEVLKEAPVKNKEIEIEKSKSFQKELSFEEALVGGDKKANTIVQNSGMPGNLPTFEGDLNSLMNGENEKAEETEVPKSFDKINENLDNREPTEEEVKERLNKLLRGEM